MNENRKITPLNKKKSVHISNTQKVLLILMLIVASLTSLPIVVVLLVGLLPTFTLLVIDNKNINKLIIVGCFNLSGVFIYMFNVLYNSSVDSALTALGDVFNMIIMLCSAGVGLIVYYEVPALFVYMARASNQKHIENIDKKVEKMQETWGADVLPK